MSGNPKATERCMQYSVAAWMLPSSQAGCRLMPRAGWVIGSVAAEWVIQGTNPTRLLRGLPLPPLRVECITLNLRGP